MTGVWKRGSFLGSSRCFASSRDRKWIKKLYFLFFILTAFRHYYLGNTNILKEKDNNEVIKSFFMLEFFIFLCLSASCYVNFLGVLVPGIISIITYREALL